MSRITTHVLNTASGRPAAGIAVTLEFGGQPLAKGVTDADGRARNLLPPEHPLAPGLYRLRFATAAVSSFFPEIEITFFIDNPEQHHHIPLLLSPYGYTTYRGS